MSKKTTNGVILLGIAIVLIALALPKINLSGKDAKNGETGSSRDQRVQIRTEVIRSEKISGKVHAVGTILSNEEVEIRSEINGKIEKIFFKEGSRIGKGDLLIKINDDELQARLLSARYRQELSAQQEERQRSLFEKKLASQQEYDTAVNNLNVIKAEVQLIQAQIDKTEIRAPFDGMIGLRFVSEGSYLSPANLITTLQDNNTVKIDFTFPEKYAGIINHGDKITFTVEGSKEKFEGSIYAIAPKIDPVSRALRVRAASPNTRRALVPGGFANVEVSLKESVGLTIPSFAIIPELKRHKVFLLKDGKAREQVVEIGTRTDDRVQITKGLQAGDTLIISAMLQLRPDMPVQPTKE